MKTKKIMAVCCVVLVAATFAFAKKPKNKTGRPEMIDYKGQALGREIPEWVNAVVDGDKSKVKKELKLDDKAMIFVLTRDGDNLDFLKTWVDQIDARGEVAASLETTIANTVEAELEASQIDNQETVERAAKMYSAQATNITLNGLQKVNDYWTKTRTLKVGLKKAKKDDDYIYKTTYYVVFSMDSEDFKNQLEAAFDDVEDNDEQTAFLRGILAAKCQQSLLGS